MMLRYSFGMTEEADAIENAVNKVLDKGLRTADNMSEGCTCLGCTAMGDAILAEIRSEMNRPLCQRERAATSPEGGAGKACGLD